MEYQRVMSCDSFQPGLRVLDPKLACAMVNGIIMTAVGGAVRELVNDSIKSTMIV